MPYKRVWNHAFGSPLVQVNGWLSDGTKPLFEAMKKTVLYKMAAIFFMPQCVNSLAPQRFEHNFR